MNEAIRMQISAYVDGELPQNEAELLLRRLCQDAELRQQASEYLAIGRAMRGETSLADTGALRQRIADVIDEKPMQEELEIAKPAAPRFLRPIAGVAIAATVALAAIVGLQQTASLPDAQINSDSTVVIEEPGYTVPVQPDSQLREKFMQHNATSSELGANNINARLVTLELREGELVEVELPVEPVEDDDSAENEDKNQATAAE